MSCRSYSQNSQKSVTFSAIRTDMLTELICTLCLIWNEMELIRLESYNPNWGQNFDSEAKLIKNTLNTEVKIHHVGSTAVEDLKSKPIIDIALEADEFPPSIQTIDSLKSIGYTYKGESGIVGREWFIKGEPRKFNLHYCKIDSLIVRNQIKFRDELRTSKNLRREYEELKMAHSKGKDIDDTSYALSKTSLIEKIIKEK